MKNNWTNEEVWLLKNNHAIKSHKNLCEILSHRTWSSIQHKASNLGLSLRRSPQQRFWQYVDKKNVDECWNWIGHCVEGGYGQFKVYDKTIYVHRFSWELHFDEICNDDFVLHKCNNPKCVNPDHLYLGDHKDNMRYMTEQNRQAKEENNGGHKLTMDQVKKIRNLKGELKQIQIARMFNVHRTTIKNIHRNKTWKS